MNAKCGYNRRVRLKEILKTQTCKKGFNVCPGPQTKEGKDGFKGIQKEVKKEHGRERKSQ